MVTVLDLSTTEDKKNGHRFRPLHDGGQKNGHHLDFSTAEVL